MTGRSSAPGATGLECRRVARVLRRRHGRVTVRGPVPDRLLLRRPGPAVLRVSLRLAVAAGPTPGHIPHRGPGAVGGSPANGGAGRAPVTAAAPGPWRARPGRAPVAAGPGSGPGAAPVVAPRYGAGRRIALPGPGAGTPPAHRVPAHRVPARRAPLRPVRSSGRSPLHDPGSVRPAGPGDPGPPGVAGRGPAARRFVRRRIEPPVRRVPVASGPPDAGDLPPVPGLLPRLAVRRPAVAPAPPAPAVPVPPPVVPAAPLPDVAALTEHVVREIDRRFVAHRERRGRW